MAPLLAALAMLLAAAAAMPPVVDDPVHPGLSPFGMGPFGLSTSPGQGTDDAEDAEERQSVLWRALPKRVATPGSSTHGTASLREMLGRSRTSPPRKSAQFTPTGVLAENADGDMLVDPGHSYYQPQYDEMVPRYPSSGVTREVMVRQGRLVGVVRSVPGFGEVHQFLGLPYAEPPVGSQRFMPPASPSQWKGLRVADRFGPVCPQALPDLTLQDASPGRLSHVQRLLPYLQDQSEDCLYLNVYAPSQAASHSSRLPVLVYIHGESLEWNAGTPYDGSVLAAYGKVIVVTFNFRLGILGFLRPGVHDSTVSNFGLLDQVAALQWVKDNIDALGGDPQSVTLMGHSTGAACASLLLVSPVSSNLFHRAILMSGTALADWAMTQSPLQFTIQVADKLNCPLSDELAACLRKKRLSDLLAVKVTRPPFKTPFGPVVDGSVIPNEPLQLMGTYRELFSRYELLLGVTEQEAYHLLDGKSLSYGVLERDRDALLKRYTHARFEKHPDMVLASTLAEYAQDPALYHPVAAEGQRDLLLDILSDARVAAPVVKTAELHAEANRSSYLYVFTHRNKNTNYPAVDKSVQGDELAYVFGLPLTPGAARPGSRHYNMDEKRLAETIITLWTNFAKKGDPNIPRRRSPTWPKFDTTDMEYLNISIHLSVDQHYRAQQMKYWNHDLPELLRNPQTEPWSPQGRDIDREGSIYGVPRLYKRPPDREEDLSPSPPRRAYGMVHSGQDDTPGAPSLPRADLEVTIADVEERVSEDGLGRVQPSASALALSVVIVVGISFLLVNVCAFGFLYYKKNRLQMQQQFFSSQCRGGGLEEDGDDTYTKKAPTGPEGGFPCSAASSPLPLPPPLPPPQQQPRVGLGQRFRMFLNRPGHPRRDRQARGAGVGAPSGHSGPSGHSRADSKDDLYEAVRGASRSTSRMSRARPSGKDEARDDAASRMRDWVAQEVVQRCSPGFLRRGRRASGAGRVPLSASSSTDQPDTPDNASSRSPGQSPRPGPHAAHGGGKPAVQKVSVAIDATPGARSSSVLRQLPIELSKSLEETARLAEAAAEATHSTTAGMTRSTPSLCSRPSLHRSEAVDEVDGLPLERRRSVTSVVLDLQPSLVDIVVAAPSSPVAAPAMPLHSFVGPRDVNVTSRDEPRQAAELCAEEALDSIRRRNYPKVLPDLPTSGAGAAAHAGYGPLPQQLSAMQLAAARRRSLPPGHLQMARNMTFPCAYPCPMDVGDPGDPSAYNRMRPAPPPRISSTLGRRQQPVGARVMLPTTPEQPVSSPTTHGAGPGMSPPQVRYEPRVVIRAPARQPSDEDADADPCAIPVTQTSSSSVTLRRPEPRVIIKATSNNPVRAAATDDSDYGFTQPHPQVHMQQLPQVHAQGHVQDRCQPAVQPQVQPQVHAPAHPRVTVEPPDTATAPAGNSATPAASPKTVRVADVATAPPKAAACVPGSPPTIAPKPVLKKPAESGHGHDAAKSATDPSKSYAPQEKSTHPKKDGQAPPASPKAGGSSAKAPPTPPPLPAGSGKQQQKQQQRKASDSSSKTGTIKKGKKK